MTDPANILPPGEGNAAFFDTCLQSPASARADLISCLARTILESLEDMERQSGLEKIKASPCKQICEESRTLLEEIAALKAV